jgi:hypothetical protein
MAAAGVQQAMQPPSPGARSETGTPTKRLVGGMLSLSPLKRFTRGSGGTASPLSGAKSPLGGGSVSGAATPQKSSLIPSYSHSIQKREVIRWQEEQLAALAQHAQQQDDELSRCGRGEKSRGR